jgi:hypothetical protein
MKNIFRWYTFNKICNHNKTKKHLHNKEEYDKNQKIKVNQNGPMIMKV